MQPALLLFFLFLACSLLSLLALRIEERLCILLSQRDGGSERIDAVARTSIAHAEDRKHHIGDDS